MSEEATQEVRNEEEKKRAKQLKKMERKLQRAEERLVDYERLVDRTQHLLNTRIEEIETARSALAARTHELEESERRFRQLADAAFETIIIHSGEQILDCNEAATKLYHVSKKQLRDNSFLSRISCSTELQNHKWLFEPTREPIEMTHLRKDGGAALGERLRKNVEANQIETDKGVISYTISMGVTDMQADDENIETMLNRADKGLYRAKESGRNYVHDQPSLGKVVYIGFSRFVGSVRSIDC